MGKRGLVIVAAVAAAATVVLVGHSIVSGDYQSFVNQAASDVRWNNDLGTIAAEIRSVHGVTGVDSSFNALALPEARATLTVKLSADATEANLQRVRALAREGARSNEFPPNLLTMQLRTPDGSRFDQQSFAASEATSSLALQSWDSLRTAVGIPLAVSLAPSPEGYLDSKFTVVLRPLHNSRRALAKLVAEYPAALANTAGATPDARWMLPGFTSTGALPSAAALALLASVAEIAPPTGRMSAIQGSSGAALSWNSNDLRYSTIGAFYPPSRATLSRAADRDRADRVAKVVASSPGVVQNFFYESIIANKVVEYRFYAGACDAPRESSAANSTWVEHLASMGVILPSGSGAGVCLPKAP